MRYGQIRHYDIANGPGIRTTLFVTGCTHNCYNCFNKEYQDFQAGNVFTLNELALLVEYLQEDMVAGLSILGGEPLQNVAGLIPLVKEIKRLVPNKDIWIYSGYIFEDIIGNMQVVELLKSCDVLVDGPFIDRLKDPMLKFRGSSNQRIIDLKETFAKGQVVLLN